jgi:hypothetical protein
MNERWDLIELVSRMIDNDFGPRPDGKDYSPFDPGDIARHGMVEIASAYLKFTETDEVADKILSEHLHGSGYKSDNLVEPAM